MICCCENLLSTLVTPGYRDVYLAVTLILNRAFFFWRTRAGSTVRPHFSPWLSGFGCLLLVGPRHPGPVVGNYPGEHLFVEFVNVGGWSTNGFGLWCTVPGRS